MSHRHRRHWCAVLAALLPALGMAPAGPTQAAHAADEWAPLYRALRVPRLRAGLPCPTARARVAHTFSPLGYGYALGAGPAYPLGFDRRGTLRGTHREDDGGWAYGKVLWFVSPAYRGPVLVRGRRLDSPGAVGFELGPTPAGELRVVADGKGQRGWSTRPSETRVRTSGCYAYQVDGATFSAAIVFRARI